MLGKGAGRFLEAGLGWADKAAASHLAPLPCQSPQSILLLFLALTWCLSLFLLGTPLG